MPFWRKSTRFLWTRNSKMRAGDCVRTSSLRVSSTLWPSSCVLRHHPITVMIPGWHRLVRMRDGQSGEWPLNLGKVFLLVLVGRLGCNFSWLREGEITYVRHREINSRFCREWEISSRDVELWDTLLSSILKSAGSQDITRIEVLTRIAKEMAGAPYVLNHPDSRHG